jgi:hypothetical protein
MTPYERLQDLKLDTGLRITDLLAMAPKNDPYYSGAPAQQAMAQWFARLWQQFGYTSGTHLRRIHYRIVSLPDNERIRHDRVVYENTDTSWNYLLEASKQARYLRLVEPTDFVDRRNADAQIFAGEPDEWRPELGAQIEELPEWPLPAIDTDPGWRNKLALPTPLAEGYDYDMSDQPYLLEAWIEKSTMDDVLIPVCRELGINLVAGAGFQSITQALTLLARISKTNKPARVFYISDFDPAGDAMAAATARQLEYWRSTYAEYADIKLTPLALTSDQVRQYRLPRIPVKESDLRRSNFEQAYGEGAVELDALEALNPGELARLLRQAARPYFDFDLSTKLWRARRQAQREIDEAWADALAPYRDELTALAQESRAIADQYREELQALETRLQDELDPLKERLEALRQDVQATIDDFDVDVPPRPEPETNPPDEEDWLFDASREYLDQLEMYKQRRNGGR